MLIKHKKKFVVIGNLNNTTYSEITPLIVNGTVWVGQNCGHFWFMVPADYEEKRTDYKMDETGQKWRRMGNICWFTNLDFKARYEDLPLRKKYSPDEYPKYDNYDAIHIKEVKDIPCDYMGVPVTFLPKHNPKQFEILGIDKDLTIDHSRGRINGTIKYARFFIKRR